MIGEGSGSAQIVDPQVGTMAAVGALLLLVIAIPSAIADGPGPSWWSALQIGYALFLSFLCAASTRIPPRRLRRLWLVPPAMGILLLLLWPLAYAFEDTRIPWPWAIDAAGVGFAALSWGLAAGIAYALVTAALPVLISLVVMDGVAPLFLSVSVIHVGNLSFAVLLVELRRRLTRFYDGQQAASAAMRRQALAEASLAQRSRSAALIHDEVLSTLNALRFEKGTMGDEGRKYLHATIRRLADIGGGAAEDEPVEDRPVPIVAALQETLARLAPNALLTVNDSEIAVPSSVAAPLLLATAEAVRNARRHAYAEEADGPIRVSLAAMAGEVRVTVEDDGIGYDSRRVPSERLGLRRSIVERIGEIPGASVEIDTEPGRGTAVRIGWTRS